MCPRPARRFDTAVDTEVERLVDRRPRQLTRPVEGAPFACSVGRPEEHRRSVRASGDDRVGYGVPPDQGALVIGNRCFVCVGLVCLLPRGYQPGERERGLLRGVPVTGEFRNTVEAGGGLGMLFERLRDCGVELDQLVGQQLVEDCLAQERVPELVRAFLGDEHAGVGGRPRGHPGSAGRQPACMDEPGARRPRADDRRDRDQVPGVVIERHESRQHQVAERRGDAFGSSGRHQFLDEQRVPVGVVRDPVEVGGRGCVAQQDRGDLERPVGGEPVQDDAVRREATELRNEVEFGDAVLGPEGGNEQHRDPAQVGGDVAQEVPARGIDPVHVVDDEDEPTAARDVPQQIRDGIEEEMLPVVRGCPGQVDGRQRRDQPGELWSGIAGEFADDCVADGFEQPPEGVTPGRIGHPGDTASASYQRLGFPGREFLEETGLPDAGIAAHEDQRPPGRGHAFEGGRQPAPRVVAPDQMRCALPSRHAERLCAQMGSQRQRVCV